MAQAPFRNLRFKVEVEGIEASGALAVSLPEARIVAGPRSTPKLECGSLTLTRGQTRAGSWYDWWNECRHSKASPDRTVVVVLLDADGADALRWTYTGARPVAYRVSALDALQGGVLAETLEIAVKTFEASFGPASIVPKQRRRRAAR